MYTRLQRTDFYSPVSFLFFNIGSLLDTTYTSITYPRLVRTSFLVRRPAKVLFTTDFSTAQPAKAAWSVGQHERISNWHQVTRSAAASQGFGVLALQQLSERPSGGGQSDTNPQAFSTWCVYVAWSASQIHQRGLVLRETIHVCLNAIIARWKWALNESVLL